MKFYVFIKVIISKLKPQHLLLQQFLQVVLQKNLIYCFFVFIFT
jgi:hypothetical protein